MFFGGHGEEVFPFKLPYNLPMDVPKQSLTFLYDGKATGSSRELLCCLGISAGGSLLFSCCVNCYSTHWMFKWNRTSFIWLITACWFILDHGSVTALGGVRKGTSRFFDSITARAMEGLFVSPCLVGSKGGFLSSPSGVFESTSVWPLSVEGGDPFIKSMIHARTKVLLDTISLKFCQ